MAKSASKSNSSNMGAGCMVIFALPFAIAGMVMLGITIWTLYRHHQMQQWVEVPATILSSELKATRNDGSTSYQAKAHYHYSYQGKEYDSDRVSLGVGSDNIGNYQKDIHRQIESHFKKKKPFRCFVDPNHPSDATLFRDLRWEMMAFYTIFATIFGSVGLGIFAGSLLEWKNEKNKLPNSPFEPDRPWTAQTDWASGMIESKRSKGVFWLIVVAIYWNLAIVPLMSILPGVLAQKQGWLPYLCFLFPAVGLLLLSIGAKVFLRRLKFPVSVFEMASTPGVLGGQLAGVIRIPKKIEPESGFDVRLRCFVTEQSGDGSREALRYEDERRSTKAIGEAWQEGTAVPVLFALPYDKPPSDTGPDARTKWKLAVSAELPGIDYHAEFLVPAFRTEESVEDFQLDPTLEASLGDPPNFAQVIEEAKIEREIIPGGGVQLLFPAKMNRGAAIGSTIFAMIWWGVIYGIAQIDGNGFGGIIRWIFLGVFGLFGLLILVIMLDLWLQRTIVRATSMGLSIQGGWLGLGKDKWIPKKQFQAFKFKETMSSGTRVWNDLIAVSTLKLEYTIAHRLPNRMVERAVVATLKEAMELDGETKKIID